MNPADLFALKAPAVANSVVDPLSGADQFQEAQLLDLRFDALRMSAGLLLEQRLALQLREANTGVVIGRGVSEIAWSARRRATSLTAWNVVASSISVGQGTVELRLGFFPDAELLVRAERIEFYNCEVEGIGGIPDYVDDAATVSSSLASWDSRIHVVSASRIGALVG